MQSIVWSRVAIAVVIVALLATASHFFIRRFSLAILFDVIVATGGVALLRTGGPWALVDIETLGIVASIVFFISILTGIPFAISRRRRAKEIRGFDVVV